MSIQDTFSFDKDGEVRRFPTLRRFFLILVIALVGLLSFGLGRLSGESNNDQAGEISVSYDPNVVEAGQSQAATAQGVIIASSAGTKYYYPACSNNISEKNKITFASAALAEAAGYTLAANCKKP